MVFSDVALGIFRDAAVGHLGIVPEKESVGSDRGHRWMAEREKGVEHCLDRTIGWGFQRQEETERRCQEGKSGKDDSTVVKMSS
ncbi:hypothetical protein NDU88_001303 [Pleurodeles waltl]|uniref:Uncharacterized protein n=1 Tax=Pleurodeles waltl TaxID=8319 RepID=A0AAV7LCQ9_PLEWA|nr:hypothetical protein NDU88_001303 [Pleurodeles waltl]